MPYHIGAKGSNGCSGYPVVKDSDGEVMGCHDTQDSAMAQLAALHINEPDATKADTGITPTQTRSTDAIYPGIGIKRPAQGRSGGTTGSNIKSKYGKKPKKINRGTSPASRDMDGGGIVSGGGGGSMGTKSNDADFWAGSAFSKRRKQ